MHLIHRELTGLQHLRHFLTHLLQGKKQKRLASENANLYKTLKAVSRQPLINFVNLKSNTIMKKPQCKDTLTTSICQAFYRQYMLSSSRIPAKKCFRRQNFIQYRQKLLILTIKVSYFTGKGVL